MQLRRRHSGATAPAANRKSPYEHVSVGEGGQAIMGNVTQVPGETAGAAVPRLVRAVLQVAGSAWQEAVSDAWRHAWIKMCSSTACIRKQQLKSEGNFGH